MSLFSYLVSRQNQSSLMMGIGGVLGGTACAQLRGNAEFLPATLCLLFAVFAQLSGNFYYRYFNERELTLNPDPEVKAHVRGDALPFLKECSIAMLLLACMVGAALATMGGWMALMLGFFIIGAGWLTCGTSHPLLRTPFGVVCSFLLFGPVCVMATLLLQSVHDSDPLVWKDFFPGMYMSGVIGFMCINATLLYSYATYHSDRKSGKESFVTMFGRKTTRMWILINGFIYSILLMGADVQLHLPKLGLCFIVPFICLAINVYIWARLKKADDLALVRLMNLGSLNVLLMGLLSLILATVIGKPDDSQLLFF